MTRRSIWIPRIRTMFLSVATKTPPLAVRESAILSAIKWIIFSLILIVTLVVVLVAVFIAMKTGKCSHTEENHRKLKNSRMQNEASHSLFVTREAPHPGGSTTSETPFLLSTTGKDLPS